MFLMLVLRQHLLNQSGAWPDTCVIAVPAQKYNAVALAVSAVLGSVMGVLVG